MDGLFGAIVIYPWDENANLKSEVVLVLSDWLNVDSVDLEGMDIWNHAGTDRFLGAAFNHCKGDDRIFLHGAKVTYIYILTD